MQQEYTVHIFTRAVYMFVITVVSSMKMLEAEKKSVLLNSFQFQRKFIKVLQNASLKFTNSFFFFLMMMYCPGGF